MKPWYVPRWLFRCWRRLLDRDFCEACPGTRGEPGNEIICGEGYTLVPPGTVLCDYCHFAMVCDGLVDEAKAIVNPMG